MTISDFIRIKITERKTNQSELAAKAGFKNQSNVSMLLKSKNMRTENLFALLDALDCELVLKDKITGAESTITR